MVAKKLLIVTALAETATGLMLLVSPTRVVAFLLGASLEAPAALVVARIAGAALLSLGCACWLARNEPQRGTAKALVAAMLLYNLGAVFILGGAGIRSHPVGVALWPTVVLHAAMIGWCVLSLSERRGSTDL